MIDLDISGQMSHIVSHCLTLSHTSWFDSLASHSDHFRSCMVWLPRLLFNLASRHRETHHLEITACGWLIVVCSLSECILYYQNWQQCIHFSIICKYLYHFVSTRQDLSQFVTPYHTCWCLQALFRTWIRKKQPFSLVKRWQQATLCIIVINCADKSSWEML